MVAKKNNTLLLLSLFLTCLIILNSVGTIFAANNSKAIKMENTEINFEELLEKLPEEMSYKITKGQDFRNRLSHIFTNEKIKRIRLTLTKEGFSEVIIDSAYSVSFFKDGNKVGEVTEIPFKEKNPGNGMSAKLYTVFFDNHNEPEEAFVLIVNERGDMPEVEKVINFDGSTYTLDDLKFPENVNCTGAVVLSSYPHCQTCINICQAMYGVSGVFMCTLFCAPFGGLVCPLICGTLAVLISIYGTSMTCRDLCGVASYCP